MTVGSDGTAAPDGMRLDAELVRRGLARSRRRAAELVGEGRVSVAGAPARKPSQPVGTDDRLDVRPLSGTEYVSRAAHKLLGALDDVENLAPGGIRVRGAPCLDAGASTGGFTQVLLERGAEHVLAVDVGHGQLVAPVLGHPRVTVREGVNVRDLRPVDVSPAPSVAVADLSFISLRLVVPVLLGVVAPGADLLLLVKPQFEVGRERLGARGVVTSTALQRESVEAVAAVCCSHGGDVLAVLPSALPGSSGNREIFLWVRTRGGPGAVPDPGRGVPPAVVAAVARAVHDARPALVGGMP